LSPLPRAFRPYFAVQTPPSTQGSAPAQDMRGVTARRKAYRSWLIYASEERSPYNEILEKMRGARRCVSAKARHARALLLLSECRAQRGVAYNARRGRRCPSAPAHRAAFRVEGDEAASFYKQPLNRALGRNRRAAPRHIRGDIRAPGSATRKARYARYAGPPSFHARRMRRGRQARGVDGCRTRPRSSRAQRLLRRPLICTPLQVVDGSRPTL